MMLQFLRLSVIVGLLGVAIVVAGQTTEDQRPVSVSVVTDDNVNEKTILYAERVASYIYQGTGLSLSSKKHFPHSIRGWAHASFSNFYER